MPGRVGDRGFKGITVRTKNKSVMMKNRDEELQHVAVLKTSNGYLYRQKHSTYEYSSKYMQLTKIVTTIACTLTSTLASILKRSVLTSVLVRMLTSC